MLCKLEVAKILCVAVTLTFVPGLSANSLRAQDGIQNPSGSCGIRSDGDRAGYHRYPDGKWVPDCRNPLRKEYWRVFVRNGTETASIIPRPDGAQELRPACANSHHYLRSIVDRYGLCMSAASPEQAQLVNTMSLADALEIIHFLHSQLKFRVIVLDSAVIIQPFPIPSDIMEACGLNTLTTSPELNLRCLRARQPGLVLYKDRQAEDQLASRLNEIYGIR